MKHICGFSISILFILSEFLLTACGRSGVLAAAPDSSNMVLKTADEEYSESEVEIKSEKSEEYSDEDDISSIMLFTDESLYHSLDGILTRIDISTGENTNFEIVPDTQEDVRIWNLDQNYLYLSVNAWEQDVNAGIYQFNTITDEFTKVISADSLGFIPVTVFACDGVVYVQGEKEEDYICLDTKGKMVENPLTNIISDALSKAPEGSYCDGIFYQLLQFKHAVFYQMDENRFVIYSAMTKECEAIDDVQMNIYPMYKGVVYTDTDKCIHLRLWEGEDQVLYRPDVTYGVLNYGTIDKDGIFAYSVQGDSADLVFLSWDGNLRLLRHFSDIDSHELLDVMKSLTTGDGYYGYYYQDEVVITRREL